MAIAIDKVAFKVLNPVAGVPISCAFPCFAEAHVHVFYGRSGIEAVQNVDYTVTLHPTLFNTFDVTPLAPLTLTIAALVANNPTTETNFIMIRRKLPFLTDSTPDQAQSTKFVSGEHDRITMKLQELEERVNRAIALKETAEGVYPPPLQLRGYTAGSSLIVASDGQNIDAGPTATAIADAQKYATIVAGYAFAVGNHVYNAVTEGGADNTDTVSACAALQAAANAAAAVGKPLWIPKGTYRFNAGEKLIPPQGLRIIGAGRNVAKFKKVTDEAVPIIHSPYGSNLNGFQCESLGFIYTAATTVVTGALNCAISIIKSTETKIEDCLFDGKFYVGTYMDSGSDLQFNECKSRGFVNRGFYIAAGFAGATADTMKHVRVTDCVADGLDGGLIGGDPNISQGRYGFNINCFGTGTMDDVIIKGCQAYGVYGHGFVAPERCTRVHLDACSVTTTAVDNVGFFVSEGNGFRLQQAQLTGCNSRGGFQGLVITGADYVSVSNFNAGQHLDSGIYVFNSNYVDLASCISNNNQVRGINIAGTGPLPSSSITMEGCVTNNNVNFGTFADVNSTWVKSVDGVQIGNTAGTISLAGANSTITNSRP